MSHRQPMVIKPVTLEGAHVRLEPLAIAHYESLCQVGLEPGIWRWIHTPVYSPGGMEQFIEKALLEHTNGKTLPFVIIEKSSATIVGSTRYYNIDVRHYNLEIGNTWIAPKWQRTAVHTEDLLLLLKHAFEVLGCIRVQFKTDSLNVPSRTALERVGATQEGIFRNHMFLPDGRIRHSIYFSILDSEWPSVKANLIEKLSKK